MPSNGYQTGAQKSVTYSMQASPISMAWQCMQGNVISPVPCRESGILSLSEKQRRL